SSSIKRLFLPLTLFVAFALLIYGVTGYFRLSRDARCLRNSLIGAQNSQPVGWNKTIELNVGPMSFQLLRAGLSFAPLNSEARTALRAVRGGEVGVYQLARSSGDLDHASLLAAADNGMAARGWER